MSFLSFSEAISTSGVFYFYGFLTFLGMLFVNFFVLETKGKSLEEIEKSFIVEHEPYAAAFHEPEYDDKQIPLSG